MLSSILCGSWDDRLSEALQPVQLDSSIILNEIIQFADAVEEFVEELQNSSFPMDRDIA